MGVETIYGTGRADLCAQACDIFFSFVQDSDASRLNVAFPGGRSIVPILETIVSRRDEMSADTWARINFFMVDERMVHLSDSESNFKLVNHTLYLPLLEAGLIHPPQLHPFVVDEGTADQGVGRYEQLLKDHGGSYHVSFLGVGEDAHVGALFPDHHSIGNPSRYFFTMEDSPKPPSSRMTSSRALLSRAELSFALFLGEGKREALQMFHDSKHRVEDCPAKLIHQVSQAYVVTDQQVG